MNAMQNRQILIYRYGRVQQAEMNTIGPHQIAEAVRAYNSAPIEGGFSKEAEPFPNLIVTSTLRRSIDTADQLFGRVDLTDQLFREAELPDLLKLPLKLRPSHWFVVARLYWLLGADRNCESQRLFRSRVTKAARRLDDLAREHGSVALIGHGILNQYVARELLKLGYDGPRRPHWRYGQSLKFTLAKT